MNGRWFLLVLLGAAALLMPSCGASSQLVSISLIPTSVDFQGPGAQIQFKAIGTYIHPPETKDITNLVQWSSNSTDVAIITSGGLATGVNTCGSSEILATWYSNPSNPAQGSTVVATAQVVDGINNGICK
jgi:hypothetical protein